MNESKTTKRTHVVLPNDLVVAIDALVGKKKRSAFISAVLETEVMRTRQQKAFSQAAGSWTDARYPQLSTQKDVIRSVRRLRDESDTRTERYASKSRQS